jgi:transposase
MTLRQLIKDKFNGSASDAAKSFDTSYAQIYNWLSQGKEVLELKDGRFILIGKNSKISR